MASIEHLAYGNRWSARHPGEKLLLGGGLLLLSVGLPPVPGAILVLIAAVAAALLGARLCWRAYAGIFAVPIGFLAVSAATLAISIQPGGSGPLVSMTATTVAAAAEVSLRALAATASLLLIILTTPMIDLLGIIRRTPLPAPIIDVMFLIYRFLGLAADSVASMRTAQANRLGYNGLRRFIHSSGLLMAALLPRLLDRTTRLQTGLAARAYAGGEMRVLVSLPPLNRRFMAWSLIIQAAILGLSLTLSRADGSVHW